MLLQAMFLSITRVCRPMLLVSLGKVATWVHGTQRQDYCLLSMTKKKEQGQAVEINNFQVEVSVTQLQSEIRCRLMVMAG